MPDFNLWPYFFVGRQLRQLREFFSSSHSALKLVRKNIQYIENLRNWRNLRPIKISPHPNLTWSPICRSPLAGDSRWISSID